MEWHLSTCPNSSGKISSLSSQSQFSNGKLLIGFFLLNIFFFLLVSAKMCKNKVKHTTVEVYFKFLFYPIKSMICISYFIFLIILGTYLHSSAQQSTWRRILFIEGEFRPVFSKLKCQECNWIIYFKKGTCLWYHNSLIFVISLPEVWCNKQVKTWFYFSLLQPKNHVWAEY